MTTPLVAEMPLALEPLSPDPFLDALQDSSQELDMSQLDEPGDPHASPQAHCSRTA